MCACCVSVACVCVWYVFLKVVSCVIVFPGVLIAYEGLPLHLALLPKLWTELSQSQVSQASTHTHTLKYTSSNTQTHALKHSHIQTETH